MPDTHKLSMDEARKHLTSECQKSEKPRLWENHTNNVVARAREKLDEEFNAWVQEFDPQVCSCRATIGTKSSLLIGSQGSHIRVPEVREATGTTGWPGPG